MKIPNTSVRVRACSRVGECGLHSNTPIIGQREFSAASVSSNHLLCIRAGTAIRLRSPSLTTCVLRSIVSSNDGTCSRRLYAHAHAHTHTQNPCCCHSSGCQKNLSSSFWKLVVHDEICWNIPISTVHSLMSCDSPYCRMYSPSPVRKNELEIKAMYPLQQISVFDVPSTPNARIGNKWQITFPYQRSMLRVLVYFFILYHKYGLGWCLLLLWVKIVYIRKPNIDNATLQLLGSFVEPGCHGVKGFISMTKRRGGKYRGHPGNRVASAQRGDGGKEVIGKQRRTSLCVCPDLRAESLKCKQAGIKTRCVYGGVGVANAKHHWCFY